MKAYSFSNVIMLVQGQEITGWPEGDDVIMCERFEDSGQHLIGVDGKMTLSISNDRSGSITFKLMQTSESNALLTALITSQENGAFVPVFVQIKNTQGGELISGTQGYITKPSKLSFGQNANENEWIITVERLDILNIGTAEL